MATDVRGLVVLESNGKSPLLDEAESHRVIQITHSLVPCGRLLIAGVDRGLTKATIAAARRAATLGANAVLVRTPSFFEQQLTTDVFALHYTAVADTSSAPVILCNFTAFTGMTLSVEAVARLATHVNIIGMKESGGDIGTLSAVVDQTPDEFSLLAGSAHADSARASGHPCAQFQSGAFARRVHIGGEPATSPPRVG